MKESLKKPSNELPLCTPELQAKLQQCDMDVQLFVAALQSEIVKLRKLNARLEVDNISLKERVKALQSVIKQHPSNAHLTEEELQAQMKELIPMLQRMGLLPGNLET